MPQGSLLQDAIYSFGYSIIIYMAPIIVSLLSSLAAKIRELIDT